MGITTSGFYTLGNNVGQCLENNQGNKVRVAKCDDLNPKSIWRYDVGKQTVCSRASPSNCLQSGGSLSKNDTVVAVANDGTDSMKWKYDGGNRTLCNSYGKCLENNGPKSQGQEIRAFNDDGAVNKKWTAKPAVCFSSKEYSTAAVDSKQSNAACTKVCSDNNGMFIPGKYRVKGPSGYCTCNIRGACS